MSWSYPDLKAALEELSPTPADNVEATSVINAQTLVLSAQDVPTQAVLAYLLTTGEWGAVEAASQPGSGAPDQIKVISINLVRTCTTPAITVFQTSDAQVHSVISAALGGLQTAGLISATSIAALTAMIQPTVPRWDPPVTVNDVATAKGVA